MVRGMARNNVRESPNRDRIVAGDAAPRPSLFRQGFQERDSRMAQAPELINQLFPGGHISLCHLHRDILIETRERILEPPREPEGAPGKHPLAVINMV